MRTASRLLALSLALVSASADADDAPPPPSDVGRELAGHRFIPSQLVLDPFTAGWGSRTVGYGMARLDGPAFDDQANVTGRTRYTAHAIVTAGGLQLALCEWWAVRLDSNILVFTGAHSHGALAIGDNTEFNIGAGTTFSRRFGRRARAALTFDAAYSPITSVSALEAVSASLKSGHVEADGLVLTTREVTLLPGVSAAYTPARALGLVANLQFGRSFAETGAVRADENGFLFGALVDLDLRELGLWPIGLNLGWRALVPVAEHESGTEQDLEGGLFYTGDRRVVVGGNLGLRWFSPTAGRGGFALLPALVLRYYW